MIPLLFVLPAVACPTVATGTTSPLDFGIAQVAIVRQGNRTTFSVSINPIGTKQGFALVLPVPEVLAAEQVATLGAGLFPRLDGYSAPRHVDDAGCPRSSSDEGDADVDADSDSDADTDAGAVDVEAEYLVGEYQVTILSATESSGLQTWLDTNGYYLPSGSEPMLAEYIEGGSYFLAAKVADTAAEADGTPLSPLQITYESEVFSIPIRLATLNSPGEQDMIIYAIGDAADARVGISNYPQFEVPEQCIWGNASTDDFGAFYNELYTAEWAAQGDAAWAVEFAGGPNSCNPCTGVVPSPENLSDLGFVGEYDNHYLTRIHMRYTPTQADQDLMLYSSMIDEPEVISYADDHFYNYSCVHYFCDGTLTDPASEPDTAVDAETEPEIDSNAEFGFGDGDGGCGGGDGGSSGCETAGAPQGIAVLAALFAGARRKMGRRK